MIKINEAYMVSFIMDTDKEKSAITVIKANPDGKIEAVQRITGENAEKAYGLLFSKDN